MLLAMQKQYLIESGDAVVAVKDECGRIKLNQLFRPVAQSTVSGMFWGSLIGLLFIMPLAGAASGALSGKLADLGIKDEFIRQAARTLQSGNAALFLLIRKMATDKVLAALRGAGGTVMRSSFDETKEEALQTALGACRRQLPKPVVEFPAGAEHSYCLEGGLICCFQAVSPSPIFSPTSYRSLFSCSGSGC